VAVFVLRIEHSSDDFDAWKKMFDSDPVDRTGKGVRRHYVSRAADDPRLICVELAFDTQDQAQTLLDAMRGVWDNVPSGVISSPQARIFEVVEEQAY
jgi:heme-degrading monooxygenase HmoA